MSSLHLIAHERAKQDRKWGEQNHHDLYWLGILVEEVGELSKEIIEGHNARALEELVQVAAVAMAWIECIDRRPPNAEHEPREVASRAPCSCSAIFKEADRG